MTRLLEILPRGMLCAIVYPALRSRKEKGNGQGLVGSGYSMGDDNQTTVGTWIRIPLIIAGTFFMGLGIVGIFVPVLPTTPLLLLAAACYARSSQRFHGWLVNNRWFGNYVRNYLQRKGVPLKVKVLTIVLLWVTIGASVAFAVQILVVRLILILVAIGVSVHILSIRTLKQ